MVSAVVTSFANLCNLERVVVFRQYSQSFQLPFVINLCGAFLQFIYIVSSCSIQLKQDDSAALVWKKITGALPSCSSIHQFLEVRVAWVGRDLKDSLIPTALPWTVRPSNRTVDPGPRLPIQPGLELLKGWDIHILFGQPVPVLHCTYSKLSSLHLVKSISFT